MCRVWVRPHLPMCVRWPWSTWSLVKCQLAIAVCQRSHGKDRERNSYPTKSKFHTYRKWTPYATQAHRKAATWTVTPIHRTLNALSPQAAKSSRRGPSSLIGQLQSPSKGVMAKRLNKYIQSKCRGQIMTSIRSLSESVYWLQGERGCPGPASRRPTPHQGIKPQDAAQQLLT